MPISHHPEALTLLAARYKPGEFNEMRRRMARIPEGGTLIRNSVSTAPGFQLGNVFVMAGVPMIMRAMLEDVAGRLDRGQVVHTATISVRIPEGRIAAALGTIQEAFSGVSIGSYPFYGEGGAGTQLVARGRDPEVVEKAAQAVETAIAAEGAESTRVVGDTANIS
ncbi:MAG TPA: hypothetical protein VGF97_07795 [Rhizomicrobium sp.]